jgi:hypothetical protein
LKARADFIRGQDIEEVRIEMEETCDVEFEFKNDFDKNQKLMHLGEKILQQ